MKIMFITYIMWPILIATTATPPMVLLTIEIVAL